MNFRNSEAGMTYTGQCRGIATLFSLLLLTLLINTPLMAVDINIKQIEKNHKLQNIRTQIKDVESSIETAIKNVDQLFRELQVNEVAATETSTRIQQLQQQIKEKNRELVELDKRMVRQEALLITQREQLAQQIRAAYKTGRNNYLKLLLNQQEPGRVGRILAYYNYDVQARTRRIAGINIALAEIASLEQRIQSETQALIQLQEDQEQKLVEFQSYRTSRHEITSKLQGYIDDQGAQLQILQGNEQELTKLVSELKHQELAIQIFEDMPPFNTLQGKLDWPVRGKITSRFGSLRKGGKLKWQGVNIAAKNGALIVHIGLLQL